MKITNNKFLLTTFILILSGMSTKVLGLIIKIIFTRIVGSKVISLYSLVMPTYSLLLTITTLAMPSTIAKLVSEKRHSKMLSSAFIIIFIINFIVIILMHLISPFIANNLLKEKDSYYLLIAMSYTLPFASFACILKGYFYGIQKSIPHVVSNTIEQIIRLLLIIFIMPRLIKISYVHAAVGLILTSVVTEAASLIVFLLFMNKKDVINITKINFNYTKDILSLSLPNVASKIISNICYFLEPIILTNVLLYKGYSNEYILFGYGTYNAYAISTLTIPSFFITAISLSLLPEVSKYLENKNYHLVIKRLKQAILYALILGISFAFIICIFRYQILSFLYNDISGANMIKMLSPFFTIFYLEAIFSSFISGIGKNHIIFKITFACSIIKIITLLTLGLFGAGIYSLLISEIINIILTVLLYTISINRYFKYLPR